jgi:hypothetical protein
VGKFPSQSDVPISLQQLSVETLRLFPRCLSRPEKTWMKNLLGSEKSDACWPRKDKMIKFINALFERSSLFVQYDLISLSRLSGRRTKNTNGTLSDRVSAPSGLRDLSTRLSGAARVPNLIEALQTGLSLYDRYWSWLCKKSEVSKFDRTNLSSDRI